MVAVALNANLPYRPRREFKLPKFDPWRLLRPLRMFDGQFYPLQPIQFMDGLLTPVIGTDTVLKTNFSEYPTGSAPADWTARDTSAGSGSIVSASGSLSGKAFQFTNLNSGSGVIIYSWDRVPSTADVEILIRGRQFSASGDTKPIVNCFGRGASLTGSRTYYGMETRYRTASSNDTLVICNRVLSGGVSQLASLDGPGPLYSGTAPTTWLWNRFRINGSTISGKSWQDGQAEPGSNLFSASNSDIASAAPVGIIFTAVSAVPVIQIDFFSVGLNGDAAPGP